MELLFRILACGIWPSLPIAGYWLYIRAKAPLRTISLPSITLFALFTSGGIALFSLPMLLSAILHLYRPEGFGLIGWTITILFLWVFVGKRGVSETLKRLRLRGWNLILWLGLCLAALLYLGFAGETILGGRDEGVYANHAVYIAGHGRVDIPFPYPEHLTTLFKGARRGAILPGFKGGPPTIKVQFGHLFPVWLAQAYSTFGYQGLFRLNAFFALVFLCVFYGLCCLLIPKPYAVAATLFLAYHPAQLWIARITLTEILTQLFIWSGLFLFVLASKRNDRKLAGFAGIFIGFSAIVRIDSFFLLPLFLLAHVSLKILEEPTPERASPGWPSFYWTTSILFVFAAGYYALFSTPYFVGLSWNLMQVGVAGVILFVVLLLPTETILRHVRPFIRGRTIPIAGCAVLFALALYAYWVRPHVGPYSVFEPSGPLLHGPRRTYREDSLINLAQYLSPFVIWAAVVGCGMMFWKMVRNRSYFPLMGVFTVIAGFSILYLWNPNITPYHFWAVRRFLPVVIPGMILFAAFGTRQVLEKIPKVLSVAASISVVMILSLFIIRSDALIFRFSENNGVFKQLQGFADRLPKDQIILCDRGIDTGIDTGAWATPLYISFDRKIVPISLYSEAGIHAVRRWLEKVKAENKHFYLLHEGGSPPKGLISTKVDEFELVRRCSEQTVHPLPKAILEEKRIIGFYQIDGLPSNYMNVTLGAERCFGVLETGFHFQESIGGKPFRWTNGNAKLIVPLSLEHPPRSLRVEFFSHCPKELRLRIFLNHHEIYQGQVATGFWSKTFSLSGLGLGNEATIEIISDTFVPEEIIKGSLDARTLGVTVQDILFLDTD